MISETCCDCGGAGKHRIEMAFGHVDADCTSCGGTGKVSKRMLYRGISDLISKNFKPLVEQEIYAKSPIMELLEAKVAAAQVAMSEALAKDIWGSKEAVDDGPAPV